MLAVRSGQALLRHTGVPAESCFLPDLTRFTGSRCAGPDPRHFLRAVPDGSPSLEREFSPPYVGLGYRAPRAPRLARRLAGYPLPPRSPVRSTAPEGCESGRIGTLGKRVWGNSPWVRIPLPPPRAVLPGQSGSSTGSREWRDTHVTQRISWRDAPGPRARPHRDAASRRPRARGRGGRRCERHLDRRVTEPAHDRELVHALGDEQRHARCRRSWNPAAPPRRRRCTSARSTASRSDAAGAVRPATP